MNKPKWCLYGALVLLFLGITIFSFFCASDRVFALLIGIGCGGIASVIVACLIDQADYAKQRAKQKQLAVFALNNFRVAVCGYFEVFADVYKDIYPNSKEEKHTFEGWLNLYSTIFKSDANPKTHWTLSAIEDVETAFKMLESISFLLIAGEIITIEDYKKIKMLSNEIRSSKIIYLIKDQKPRPYIILEKNEQIADQVKIIDCLSDILLIEYSGNGDLADMNNAVNEMDYLQ